MTRAEGKASHAGSALNAGPVGSFDGMTAMGTGEQIPCQHTGARTGNQRDVHEKGVSQPCSGMDLKVVLRERRETWSWLLLWSLRARLNACMRRRAELHVARVMQTLSGDKV